MKRILALLVGVAAVVLVASRPVAAAPGAPEGNAAVSVPADAVGLSLSQVPGAGLAVTLDAGASEEHDLVVSNHTADLRLTIKLSATDATGNLGSAAASWLAFGDDAIQLEPHVATTVPMTIAVPHDTQPGSALAHVTATVESAVAAADGSPVAGTAHETFPVSIDVRGTPTAQIAIADVHRVDDGSHHQLALVLRNFGDQGAQVSGHVVVAGNEPQTLPFQTDLAPSRDTTVNLGWKPPPSGSPSDIAVDLEYGGGNVASWSSRLGGAPTDLSPPDTADSTPTTNAVAQTDTPASDSTTPAKPLWKQPIATVLAILALLGAGVWFAFEMRASRRRREWMPEPGRGAAMPPPGWVRASSADSIDLARQLVRLTEVVVELVATHRDQQDVVGDRARARSPGLEHDELGYARAGPAPPEQPTLPFSTEPEIVRSAPTTPSAVARPDAPPHPVAPIVAAQPVPGNLRRNPQDEEFEGAVAHPVPGNPHDEELEVAVADPVPGNLARNLSDEEIAAQIVAAVSLREIPPENPPDEESQVAPPEPVPANLPKNPRDGEMRAGGGPVDPDDELVALMLDHLAEQAWDDEPAQAASLADEAEEPIEAVFVDDDEEEADPRVAMMQRIADLDSARRRLRDWMDAEESGEGFDPPDDWYLASTEESGPGAEG